MKPDERAGDDKAMLDIREELAALMYEIWGDQMRHVFLHCEEGNDGPIIPWVLFDQWDRQVTHTPYNRLSEERRRECQQQADKVLALFRAYIIEKMVETEALIVGG